MTNVQIDALFFTMDKERDEQITDEEWADFFTTFIEPFYKGCAAKDDGIPISGISACMK